MPAGNLNVTVVSARELKKKQHLGRQDPYVIVEAGSTKLTTKTHTDGGRNPKWDQRFEISLAPDVDELKLSVWNANVLQTNDLIGTGRLTLGTVFAQKFHDARIPLTTQDGKSAGEVHLLVTFQHFLPTPQQPSTITPSRTAGHAGGEFRIRVLRGCGLQNVEVKGQRQDPYCVLQVGTTKFKTKTVTDGDKNPKFDESFTFSTGPQDTELTVEMWNANLMMTDKIIGSGRVSLREAMSKDYHEVRVPLKDPMNVTAGELELFITYQSFGGAAASAPAAPLIAQPAAQMATAVPVVMPAVQSQTQAVPQPATVVQLQSVAFPQPQPPTQPVMPQPQAHSIPVVQQGIPVVLQPEQPAKAAQQVVHHPQPIVTQSAPMPAAAPQPVSQPLLYCPPPQPVVVSTPVPAAAPQPVCPPTASQPTPSCPPPQHVVIQSGPMPTAPPPPLPAPPPLSVSTPPSYAPHLQPGPTFAQPPVPYPLPSTQPPLVQQPALVQQYPPSSAPLLPHMPTSAPFTCTPSLHCPPYDSLPFAPVFDAPSPHYPVLPPTHQQSFNHPAGSAFDPLSQVFSFPPVVQDFGPFGPACC